MDDLDKTMDEWAEMIAVENLMEKSNIELEKSAKEGNKLAAFALAENYSKRKLYSNAYPYYLMAAKQGYAPAQRKAAILAQNSGNETEAIQLLQSAIKNNDVYSHYLIADYYFRGKLGGFFKKGREKEGFQHYLIAAKAGIPEAQYKVASGYFVGKGTKISSTDFLFWLGCAYLNGYPKAIDAVNNHLDNEYRNPILKNNLINNICPKIVNEHPEYLPEYLWKKAEMEQQK